MMENTGTGGFFPAAKGRDGMEIGTKQAPFPRGAGVLLPVFSLPSPQGIGTFGREARRFADFLRAAGQSWWQVLPLGPTGFGDSPYQSFSAFAGNPYFIDPGLLAGEGLLSREEAGGSGRGPARVDYAALYRDRFPLLRKAFARAGGADAGARRAFCAENAGWLEGYSLFMALKTHFGGREWLAWPEDIRLRRPAAVERYRAALRGETEFWKFCQFKFFGQWRRLKAYANARGIRIIGDLPLSVSLDSADVWTHPELFQLDEGRRPVRVAGVPPDRFSAGGQLWGNPLYDWDAMRGDGFSWWRRRMGAAARLYDAVRIDHFIGIVRYYAVPRGSKTAEGGEWRRGPGEELIRALAAASPGAGVIAEDLGCAVPEVEALREAAGYPGMKVLEYAFDSGGGNPNLPCHYAPGCVVYTGTHDNETLAGFFRRAPRETVRFARAYLHVRFRRQLPAACVRAACASAADTAIIPMQDWLGLGNGARINRPATVGGNWRWRLRPGRLNARLAARMRGLCGLYGRLPAEEKTEKEK